MTKQFCEDMVRISVGDLKQANLLRHDKVGYMYLDECPEPRFRLRVDMDINSILTVFDERGEMYTIQLEEHPVAFGGTRYWFKCPLSRDGAPCTKRVYLLYLGERGFGCRECLGLVYKSQYITHSNGKKYWYQMARYLRLANKYFNLRTKWFKGRPTKRHQGYANKQQQIDTALKQEHQINTKL